MGHDNNNLVLAALLAFSLFCLVKCGYIYNNLNLRNDEKHSEYVRKAADFATTEIHKQKLKNGEYDRCTVIKNDVLSGKKKVGGGIKYLLQLRIRPETLQTEECSKEGSRGSKWKPEMCETEIMWQAWKKPEMELLRSVCLKLED